MGNFKRIKTTDDLTEIIQNAAEANKALKTELVIPCSEPNKKVFIFSSKIDSRDKSDNSQIKKTQKMLKEMIDDGCVVLPKGIEFFSVIK